MENKSKRKFVFDHVWGIPGDTERSQVSILQDIFKSHKEQARPLIVCVSAQEEEDIRKKQIMCGNSSLGRTMVDYCLNTSLPGVKYLVYCPDHVLERAVWGILWLLCIFLALYCSVQHILTNSAHPFIFTKTEETVHTPLPPVIICPEYAPSQDRKSMVEQKLPVMKFMWNYWDYLRRGQKHEDQMLWRNESQDVERFYSKVMYEAGMMAMDDCEDILASCAGEISVKNCCKHSRKIFTNAGLCLELSSGHLEKIEDQVGLKLDFLQIHQLLPVSVRLDFLESGRIGHPVLSIPSWGETYLCDDQWGEEEAQVICRGLGFNNGRRFYKSQPRMELNSFGEYFGKFECNGTEESLFDCSRSQFSQCKASEKISSLMCDVGGLNGVHMKTKTKGFPYLEGPNGQEYFCKEEFGSFDASVFCRMLSWTVGKVTLALDDKHTVHSHSPKCGGTETHIQDCPHQNISSDFNCSAAHIECSPGFPLTIRLHHPTGSDFLTSGLNISLGYPVIDTTANMGVFCSKGTSQSAVTTMCRMMGYKEGMKLPPGLFGNPTSPQEPFFVFEKVNCLGEEKSVFDCDLAPWGVEGCEGGDILTILCGEEGVEGITVEGEENGYDLLKKIIGYSNDKSLITPKIKVGSHKLGLCLGDSFGQNEANILCQTFGYDCGMVDYTQTEGGLEEYNETYFGNIICPTLQPTYSISSSLSTCQITLTTSCPFSPHPASLFCLPLSQCTTYISSPLSVPWSITLSQNKASCAQVYLGKVKPANRVYLSSNQANTMLVTTTITRVEEEAIEQEDREKACLTSLILAACQCLPWMHNIQGKEQPCVGEDTGQYNCSQTVGGLHSASGGDCLLAMVMVEQRMRISLPDTVRDQCVCTAAGNRVQHSVQQAGVAGCGAQSGSLTIIRDHGGSAVYQRLPRTSWLELLGTVGGLVAVITGASVISGCEIVYWLSVRLWEQRRKDQAHKEEVYTENKAIHGSDTTIMSKETRTDQNIETMLSSANTYSPRKASSNSSSRTAWEEDTLTEGERRE